MGFKLSNILGGGGAGAAIGSLFGPVGTVVGGLAGGALGAASDSDKVTPEVAVVADPYGETRNKYLSWLNGQIGQAGKTYTGERVAGMSDAEKKSQEALNQYANRGTPSTLTAAKRQVEATLGGEYDPTKSPYYQSVKAEAARNLEDTQDSIKDTSAGRGAFWTGARAKLQADAATDQANALNTLLGQLALQERQNQLSVLDDAQNISNTEDNANLKTATALQELGGLPREIQQAINEAAYNEWLRSEVEYPLNIGQMAGNTQRAPMYAQVGYQPNIFQQLLSTITGAAGSAFGQKAGSSLGSSLFASK